MFCLDDGAELLYGPASIDELIAPGAVSSRMMLDGLRDNYRFAARTVKVEQSDRSLNHLVVT